MESPCINICLLDEDTGLCRGCLRTLDEIGNWSLLTSAERSRIMASLEARRADANDEQSNHDH